MALPSPPAQGGPSLRAGERPVDAGAGCVPRRGGRARPGIRRTVWATSGRLAVPQIHAKRQLNTPQALDVGVTLSGGSVSARVRTSAESTPDVDAVDGTAGPRGALLDVLVPHFEDVEGLKASLSSIESQTWRGSLRVVIVDDGSSPTTIEAVQEVVAKSPLAITLRLLPTNVGRPAARNALLDEVNADYVSWLDAGDEWLPEKLEMQFAHLRELEFEGVDLNRVWVTSHYLWVEDGTSRCVLQHTNGDQTADLLMGESLRAYLWTLLGRTSSFRAAGLFDECLSRMQDLDYFIRFVAAGGVISAPRSRQPLCRYFKTDAGRSHRAIAQCSNHILVKHHPLFAAYGRGFVGRAQWKYSRLAARFALNNGSFLAAGAYLVRGVLRNPRYSGYRVKRRLFS